MLLLGCGAIAPGAAALVSDLPVARSPYYGRWTVAEDRPVFTARGRLYKTIDVAPCGSDFCGVSVDDKGGCGAVLFRFLGKHANGEDMLRGHGKWGDAQKNVEIYAGYDDSAANSRTFELSLGDGHDFGGRSENMPKFHANYRRVSGANCRAR